MIKPLLDNSLTSFASDFTCRQTKTIPRIIVYFLAIISLSGCMSLTGKNMVTQTDQGVEVLHLPGDEQFSYIKKNKSLVRLCTETNIDSSLTSSSGFSLGALGDSFGDKSSSGAVTLGGRDPTVLITRELMFRACELSLNANLEPDDATKIYKGTLDVLIDIIKAHKGVGTKSVTVSASKLDMLSANAPISSSSVQQIDESSNTSVNSIDKDFSGFSWNDYPNHPNTFNSGHP